MIGDADMPRSIDEFLFGGDLELKNYYIERTPISEVICFTTADGREYDLAISDPQVQADAVARLVELGVRIVEKTWPAGHDPGSLPR